MIRNDIREIAAKQVNQVGEQILIHCECPKCKIIFMHGYSSVFECENCDYTAENIYWNTENCRYKNITCTNMRRTRTPTKKTVKLLERAQGGVCAYCDGDITKEYHIDHIRPFSAGGGNNIGNICLCCPRCNRTAFNYWFANFDHKRLYIVEQLKSTKEYR
jgi:5-methylcytosine-specific restriction endonuclease McrA